MAEEIPEGFNKQVYYRVNRNGITTNSDSWEKILALPDGIFYLERILKSSTCYSGNWHKYYEFNIIDKERKFYCPKVELYSLLSLHSFENTSSWPTIKPYVKAQFESESGEIFDIERKDISLERGLKDIFFEIELLSSRYKGSVIEYIINEQKNGYFKVNNPNSISIIKSRYS
jgi:hypothetical protein